MTAEQAAELQARVDAGRKKNRQPLPALTLLAKNPTAKDLAHVAKREKALSEAHHQADQDLRDFPKAAKRNASKHPESNMQQRCVAWFRSVPAYRTYRLISIPNGTHLAGGPKKRAVQMGILKREGLQPGASDLLLILPGRVVFLEAKWGKNKQSTDQQQFEADVSALNHVYRCFWTLDEFREIVAGEIEKVKP